jgi:hypothetical protein
MPDSLSAPRLLNFAGSVALVLPSLLQDASFAATLILRVLIFLHSNWPSRRADWQWTPWQNPNPGTLDSARSNRDRSGSLATPSVIIRTSLAGSIVTALFSRLAMEACFFTGGCIFPGMHWPWKVKNFRQLHSITPGHLSFMRRPASRRRPVPWPGCLNAVGYALRPRYEARFNTPEHKVFDHHVVCLAGDGCLQEGCRRRRPRWPRIWASTI